MRLARAGGSPEAWPGLLAIADHWTPPSFPVTGDDVVAAGASPGPEVGRILKALQDAWLDADFQPDRTDLLARLRVVLARGPT
jgi:poly(A) polymerase